MQVYVRGQAAAADRAEAQAAFARHCSRAAITAMPSPAEGRLALARPCAWPHPQRLSTALEDSHRAALALEASLLESFISELAAQQALQSSEGKNTLPYSLSKQQLDFPHVDVATICRLAEHDLDSLQVPQQR